MQKASLIPVELPYAVNEELKYLRANLLFAGVEKKVILITSSAASEGKSSTTRELAKAMAGMGKHVLLIDTDIRRSNLRHEFSNREQVKYGLSHFLAGMVGIDDIMIDVENVPGLYVIVSGPGTSNPAELLAGKRVGALLDWAKQQFDYVFVDTAPLGVVADASAVAPKCDGAIIVVETGKTPIKVVQTVARQLTEAGCPVIGAVLNKSDVARNRRYYKHYYRKYEYEYNKQK